MVTLVTVSIFVACSTEKNTFINRTYHNTTARYNGYFNANELVKSGLYSFRQSQQEDYYNILPIEHLPNKDEAINLYPAMDTAISKCSKVIGKHSMPSMEKLSKKKDEHCDWIDENWMLIGKANFYKTDYEEAVESFEFVKKFYKNNASVYDALVWLAKCEIEIGNYTQAGLYLKKVEELEGQIKDARAEYKKLDKKKKKKQKPMAKFNKDLKLELFKTKARLALEKDETDKAIEFLTLAIDEVKKNKEKARLNFIIGQLLQEKNDTRASEFYAASIKRNANYEMAFHAKINKALAGGEGEDKVVKDLKRMLRDQKNVEYKDQIYYALAEIDLRNGNEAGGIENLSNSVFYSLKNNRQKGISYERLGDIAYAKKDYVPAQKYFDSSANVLPDSYPTKEIIQNKADKLFDLAKAIQTIEFEDSVQMIAALSDKDREKFLKDVVKQIKEEKKRKAEEDARRLEELRQLQQSLALQNNGQGGKWYFNNTKAMTDGFNEFRRIWGQREDEDNWRRSNKTEEFSDLANNDTLAEDSTSVIPQKEELSAETLMANIPLTDSAITESNNRILEALYTSGMIYQNQLNEFKLAEEQFVDVLDRKIENRHNALSAYQLYKMFETKDKSKAEYYRNYIFNNYPNSDYANFLRDPEFFKKKKELDALALDDYLRSVKRYEQGLFYPVIAKADKAIEETPANKYKKNYLLLKAMAMGKVNPDKTTLLPVLNRLISEYPESNEAARAKELITLINNGVPDMQTVDFSKPASPYEFVNKEKMMILVFLNESESSSSSRVKVANFNREYFSRDKLKTLAQVLNDKNVIIIKDFDDTNEAEDYIRVFKKTRKNLGDLKDRKLIFISPKNFKTFVKRKKLKEYEQFVEENY